MPEAMLHMWEVLTQSPLFGLTITILAYLVGEWVNARAGGTPILHPVLLAIGLLIGVLLLADIPYETYFSGARFIHFLLGPATVALAVPLFDHREQIRRLFKPLAISCLAGVVTAVGSTLLLAELFGAQRETTLSLAPKSVTTPIAMGISEQIGGVPSVTAVLVLITGAIGCICVPWLMRCFRIEDHAVHGFALGMSAHGFGTAQAFYLSQRAGAFSGLAMGAAGVITAFLLPLWIYLLGWS